MKKLLFAMLATLAIAISGSAQKIKVNEIDRFTKKIRIESSFEKLNSDNSPFKGTNTGITGRNVWVAMSKVGDDEFLRLKWATNDGEISLDQGDKIIFLDDKGESYEFLNAKYTIAGKGEGTVGFIGSALYGVNLFLLGDFSSLKDKVITEMRIYTNVGYVDFVIKGKKQTLLSDLYKVFEEAKQK